MFDVTKEEIKEALNSTGKNRERVQLKDQEEATFIIQELKEKENDNGGYLLCACKFVGGNHDGKDYAIFMSSNQKGKKTFVRLANALVDQDTFLKANKAQELYPYMVGKKFKTKASLNEWQGKTYTNFLFFEEVSGPQLQAVANSDIPF